MSSKNKLIKLSDSFDTKLSKISNEMTESLYLVLIGLTNDSIEMNAFQFTLDCDKKIFIRRVFAKFNHSVLIEYTSNCYEYHTLDFNDLVLSDKIRLYHYLAKYGNID